MKFKKIALLAIPMLALGGGFLSLKETHALPVRAEEVVEVVAEEPEESKFENFKNTYLVPILSGVSITAVLSFITSVGLAVYNSKVNKKTRVLVKGCLEQVFATLKIINALVVDFQQANKLSKETIKLLDESFQRLLDQLKLLEKATNKVDKLREAIVLVGQMQKELAKADKSAITSGVAKKLVELEAKLKELE